MYSKLKLYLLFIPYTVAILLIPDVYKITSGSLDLILLLLVAISLISSFLYCYRFLKVYKHKKAAWHSLGHMFFFIILCFSSSIVYLQIHGREGMEGLGTGIFIIYYWWISSPIIISIVLSAVILFLKSFATAKGSSHSIKTQQNNTL